MNNKRGLRSPLKTNIKLYILMAIKTEAKRRPQFISCYLTHILAQRSALMNISSFRIIQTKELDLIIETKIENIIYFSYFWNNNLSFSILKPKKCPK